MKKYSAQRVYDHLMDSHRISTTKETLFLVVLDADGHPEASYKVATGSAYSVDVGRVEEVLLRLARQRAFVVAHSHTSGSVEPSTADKAWTRDFRKRVGRARFVDHLILTKEGYGSL